MEQEYQPVLSVHLFWEIADKDVSLRTEIPQIMSEQELNKILSDAVSLPAETEIVEFKEAKENYDFGKIGKYFSALSNEANLKGKSCAWLIFGVENTKHRIVGSNYRPNRKDLDSLKKEIGDKTTQNISFIEIYELRKPEGRVIMFQIPAAPQGIPVAFEGYYHGRANESLAALNIEKIERIRNQVIGKDWSRNIVPEATFDDLDKEAIRKAREEFKKKHPALIEDVDSWEDITFLNKAKVTLNGRITNTAILLLGKDEASPLISPAIAQISWILKDDPSDYEHFHTPFILTVEKALSRIRNLRYRHLGFTTLFPDEVYQYDSWVIREALNNSVAHQDYGKSGRIHLLEYKNRLVFENVGGFIPDSIEAVIKFDSPQHYYRNPFLAEAMVNLNMIDTVGSGIKKMFTRQKERFFSNAGL
jgi:ATP-dependent DNA helicase RecG